MITLSVNEAIERLDARAGSEIRVRGLLVFEFENVSIGHVPLVERASGYASSIWLDVGLGSLSFDETMWERLHRKVVVVQGTLHRPDPKFGGCGHMSLWPAEIFPAMLERAPNV